MNKRLFGIGSVVGLIALIALGVFAVAGGLGGDSTAKATDDTAREATCLEGATDCNDMLDGESAGGDHADDAPAYICIEGATDCNDTPTDSGGAIGQTYMKDNPDCNDTGLGGLQQVCAPDAPDCVDSSEGSDGFGGSTTGEPVPPSEPYSTSAADQ